MEGCSYSIVKNTCAYLSRKYRILTFCGTSGSILSVTVGFIRTNGLTLFPQVLPTLSMYFWQARPPRGIFFWGGGGGGGGSDLSSLKLCCLFSLQYSCILFWQVLCTNSVFAYAHIVMCRSNYCYVWWCRLDLQWTLTQENLSLGFANNKGADQPAHQRRLIGAFVISFLESIIFKLAMGDRWHFNFLDSLCSWGDWFESHFVGNPEDRFLSHRGPNKPVYEILVFIIWATSWQNLSSGVCEHQKRRPACAFEQSDQRLCYSLIGKYHIETCFE